MISQLTFSYANVFLLGKKAKNKSLFLFSFFFISRGVDVILRFLGFLDKAMDLLWSGCVLAGIKVYEDCIG